MTRPEKESVRPRRGIEEVEQSADGVQIEAWVHWSEWGWMGLYIREGNISTPPPPPPSPPPVQFLKEEEERGKWEAEDGCVPGGVVVGREVGSGRLRCYLHIILIWKSGDDAVI